MALGGAWTSDWTLVTPLAWEVGPSELFNSSYSTSNFSRSANMYNFFPAQAAAQPLVSRSRSTKLKMASRAFAVPEVQLEIFKRLDAGDLGRSARVCKAWTSLALDTKWRTCQIRLSRLLSRLAPLKVDSNRSVSKLLFCC